MSRQARSVAPVVHRVYAPSSDYCARALGLLLKTNISEKGGPAKTALDDAKEIKSVRAEPRVP